MFLLPVWMDSLQTVHSYYNKLRVAFSNVYQRILKLPPRSRASAIYANNIIDRYIKTLYQNVHLDLLKAWK